MGVAALCLPPAPAGTAVNALRQYYGTGEAPGTYGQGSAGNSEHAAWYFPDYDPVGAGAWGDA